MGLDSTGDGGSGSVSMAPSSSMNVDPTPAMPHASTTPFPIPITITQHTKQIHEYDASVGKMTPLPMKLSVPSSNEELFGIYPIIEETREMQDLAVTTSDALQ